MRHRYISYPPTVGGGDFDFLEKVFEGLDNIYFYGGTSLYRGTNMAWFKRVGNPNTAWSVFIKIYFPFIDNDLLDIGRNMASTTGHEKSFYIDQKTARNCRLSEEIDEDFESECQALLDIQLQQRQQVEREYDFIVIEEEPLPASKTS